MKLKTKLTEIHRRSRSNMWMQLFTISLRIALALGFIPSGMVKILGERFTALAITHPMGSYLEAIHHTGYYYTFIGIMQVAAAILLLIPRTALLGALLYLPIIFNIFVLSFAVRFDGSLFTSPLMVLGVLYLLCWDFHRLKPIFVPDHFDYSRLWTQRKKTKRFPFRFALIVLAAMVLFVLVIPQSFELLPRNSLSECKTQCAEDGDKNFCLNFCECIHLDGQPLDACLQQYYAQQK